MFEILVSFMNKIMDIDAKYDKEIKAVEVAEKEALAAIEANHKRKMAELNAEHQRELQRINNMPKPTIVKDETAIKKHQELVARFEAILAKHSVR